MSNPNRPIVMSIVQYTDAIESQKMTVLELVEKAGELDVDGIELRRELWGDGMNEELPAVKQKIESLNLQVTFATHDVLFCEGDDYDQLLADVDTAAQIGSPLLRIFSGPVPTDENDPAWDKAKAVIDRAEKNGILIALENYANSPGGTLAEIQTVLNHFQVPTLKTNIDTGNYAGWKQDILEAIQAIGNRAAYVHVKDPSEGGTSVPGEGDLPMKEIFAALDTQPQKIIYCFEFPGGNDPEDRIQRASAFMKDR
ncbi:MAG: sugar phosphate isomerase/epimerase [Candidatus Latescibacteria bacterium]|jgi:sugar phosphate isomerase/epimerase|nr:sugar phosphate isomerase/epimerase [Candidatus Latescibacterota bacterium]